MNHRQSILEWITTIIKYVLIVILILFFVKESKRFYEIGYSVFAQEAVSEEGQGRIITVEVTDSMSVSDIGQMLEEKGLIENAEIFPIQERFSSSNGKMKPGIYDLSTEMTPDEMMAVMSPEEEEEE